MGYRLVVVLAAVVVTASIAPPQPSAQVVRESETTSIAGLLGGGRPAAAWWTFKSAGNEILFASLDAEVYRVAQGGHEGEATAASAPAADEGGGGGGCGGDEGGPARFCLQVIDPYDVVLCESTRPAPPPGWQRDPRLACQLPASKVPVTYTVRVSAATHGGGCMAYPASATLTDARPFLLDLSLRRLPPSGITVQQASALSRNQQ